MTKKLEELFDLQPKVSESLDTVANMQDLIEKQQNDLQEAGDIIERIDRALPQVNDLDMMDNEMDELADLARRKFEDLMDLGMNVEARFSGTILQTAGVLLGHAISAKQTKIDKKLRMVDLQLKKMKLDQSAAKNTNEEPPLDGQAIVLDRNELLKQILETAKQKKE